MLSTIKKLLLGIFIGALVGFPLGINYGREAPLLSNPLAKPTLGDRVKAAADNVVEDTRRAIHDATKP